MLQAKQSCTRCERMKLLLTRISIDESLIPVRDPICTFPPSRTMDMDMDTVLMGVTVVVPVDVVVVMV